MREVRRELGVVKLSWLAGIHLNTNTPHEHLVISRYAINPKTDKLTYIKHLPASLLPRNKVMPDGSEQFAPGKIVEAFARGLEPHLLPIRYIEVAERRHNVQIARAVVSLHAVKVREPTLEERTEAWITKPT